MLVVPLLCLLAICSFTPGFFLVRRWRWKPLEKLCGSIGLSLILVYLAAWAIYLASPPGGKAAYWAVSAICLVLGFAARRDILALVRSAAVRRVLFCYLFLLAWTMTCLAMIRVYSGCEWGGDWLEHFQRSLFFLRRFPVHTPIWGGYLLPARPPMMNVLASFFMAQTGDQFYSFQVVFTFLNLLLFLPCCLILPALMRKVRAPRFSGGMRLMVLTALFAMNPAIMENVTYSWTKGLPAFYAVLAIGLYLAAWRKNDLVRMVAAFGALAAGLLAHYSTGPYCAFLALHYLFFLFRNRPRKWMELAGIAGVSGALLATWLGWAWAVYGPAAALGSNTSVTSAGQYPGSNWIKMAGNLFDTIVPNIVRDPGSIHQFDQANPAGFIRDNAFRFYQVDVVFGMGLVGGPLILWLLYRRLRKPKESPAPAREIGFWRLLVPFCLVVGVAVVGERNLSGSAHLTLVAMEALGLTLLAAAFPWRRSVAIAVLAGCVVDFSLGVFLQARVQSLENTPKRTVFTLVIGESDGQPGPGQPTPESLTVMASANWFTKHQFEFARQWAQEAVGTRPGDAARQTTRLQALALANTVLQQDADLWHGWVAEHGYRFVFLGDAAAVLFGGRLNGLAAMLLLLFAGLMWIFAREALRAIPLPAVPPDRSPGKKGAVKRGAPR